MPLHIYDMLLILASHNQKTDYFVDITGWIELFCEPIFTF